MLLTVRSDFPIVAAICFCVAVGFVCTTRSTAISSKVQDLHFRGRLSAKFALWTAPFALWTSSLVSPSFQSMCNSRFRKLSRVRGQVLEPSIYNWEMARTARKHSDSGVYHVILRGVNKQQIFECTEDYQRFLNILRTLTVQARRIWTSFKTKLCGICLLPDGKPCPPSHQRIQWDPRSNHEAHILNLCILL